MAQASRYGTTNTILLAAAATVLGLESLRVFATNLVWYLGETSDRVVMAVVAFVAFGTVGLAWPVLRMVGFRRAAVVSTAGLVLARLVDQANAAPVADLALAFLGTMFFGWLVASRIGRGGRAAGIGIAAALGLDVAIRAGFDTVDVAFSDSMVATLVVVLLGAVAMGAVWRDEIGERGRVGAGSAWPLIGIPAGLLLFMLVTGNFGQVAVRGELGWGETVLWLSAGATAGLIRSLLPRARERARRAAHTLLSAAALGGGLAAYWSGSGGLWVGVAALGLAHLLALLPVDPDADGEPDRGGAGSAFVAAGFIVFVALLFIFYSFYGPGWVVVALPGLVVVCAFGRVTPERGTAGATLGGVGRWLVAVLAVVSLAPGVANALTHETPVPGEAAVDGQVRVLSYNIRQGFGLDDRFDLERVAMQIERHDPDVVALQEIGRGWVISGMVDQLQWLENRLGMRAYFEPNLADTWGNAFLVRIPVVGREHVRFDNPGRLPRGVQGITVATADGSLRILVTHLDSEDEGDQVRADQVGVVLELWAGSEASLVVGDMNFTPDSKGYALVAASGLRDLLREAGNDGPTRPSDNPATRIDYAFGSADLEVVRAEAPVSMASDHLPVLVEVRLP